MSLLTTLLASTSGGGGGSGSVTGTILTPAVAATTTALTVTYANGTGGVGATLTNAGAQAAFSIDGVSPTVGQRVLINNQAAPAQNGIYVVTTVGDGSHNWVLTRSGDFNQPPEMTIGSQVNVSSGTVNSGTVWVLSASVVTIGTTAVTFNPLSEVGLAASVAVVTNSAGKVITSATTATEIGYVSGVTSSIQTQLNTIAGSIDQTTTPVTLAANTTYSANNAGLVTFNMPATVPYGTTFEVEGQGAGGWLIQMNTGQTANSSGGSTTSAGSLASTNRYDCIKLRCTVANTTFTVIKMVGVTTNA